MGAINLLTDLKPLDIIGFAVLFIFVIVTLLVAEILKRKAIVSGVATRKIIHITVGNVILLFPLFFSKLWIALVGPVFFIFFTYLTCPASPIKKFRLKGVAEGHSYGTVFYAISLTVMVSFFFRPTYSDQLNFIMFGSFLPLVWGDGVSAVIGTKYGKKSKFKLLGDNKSLIGSWSGAFASTIILLIVSTIFNIKFTVAVYIGLLIGVLTAVVELISVKGLDNLTIPTVNAIVLYFLYNYLNNDFNNLQTNISLIAIIFALVVGAILAIGGVILKALTYDGAIAGFFFGMILLGLGSWTVGGMFFVFFMLGSVFTFVGKKKKEKVVEEFEKGKTMRDSMQAMVNSIIPLILVFVNVLIQKSIITIMIATALATSLADTLATEIGSLSKETPVLAIKPWKKTEKGDPGAISLAGLISSIIGAAIIAITGFVVSLFDLFDVMPNNRWLFVMVVTAGGFIGSYIDSVLSNTVQRLNKCQNCGKITEKTIHCGEKTVYYKGVKIINNDLVNLISIALSSSMSLVALFFM